MILTSDVNIQIYNIKVPEHGQVFSKIPVARSQVLCVVILNNVSTIMHSNYFHIIRF